jgi:hypothetical protein
MDNSPGRVNASGRTNNDILYWVFVITELVIQVNALLTYIYIKWHFCSLFMYHHVFMVWSICRELVMRLHECPAFNIWCANFESVLLALLLWICSLYIILKVLPVYTTYIFSGNFDSVVGIHCFCCTGLIFKVYFLIYLLWSEGLKGYLDLIYLNKHATVLLISPEYVNRAHFCSSFSIWVWICLSSFALWLDLIVLLVEDIFYFVGCHLWLHFHVLFL